ncbi:MAG: nucleotidyltransferase domain-containing protein [Desulfobulbus sp.]|nr:nucleotidyltransferase domain-containing protein [Desulfobulbus sp.]
MQIPLEMSRSQAQLEERYGVTRLDIFGSVARGQITATSDVDGVKTLRAPHLFTLVQIKETLENALQEHVDIVHYRENMNKFLKDRIDKDAVLCMTSSFNHLIDCRAHAN